MTVGVGPSISAPSDPPKFANERSLLSEGQEGARWHYLGRNQENFLRASGWRGQVSRLDVVFPSCQSRPRKFLGLRANDWGFT